MFMYSHSLAQGFTGMHHFRETEISGGAVALEEIARTVAILAPSEQRFPEINLILATEADILRIDQSRTNNRDESPIPPEQILCDDLEEFVSKGLERWGRLIQDVGSVLKVVVHLAEMRVPDEQTTASGLVIGDFNSYRFQDFAARADEIEAVERIADSTAPQLLQVKAGIGQYA